MKLTLLKMSAIALSLFSITSCELWDQAFGTEEPFLRGTGTVNDIDGNTYNTVNLGGQWWMTENLKVTRYADGTPIPLMDTDSAWRTVTSLKKAFCYYQDDYELRGKVYGALYSWAGAMNGSESTDSAQTSVQGACPNGWHVPSRLEWETLVVNVGNDGHQGEEGVALKNKGGWQTNNGINAYGFNAYPGGFRELNGESNEMLLLGYWWTATEYSNNKAYQRDMYYHHKDVHEGYEDKAHGYYLRCVKD